MKIVFNTYPVAFQCPGGGEIQLEKSRQALEQLGHDVVLFDQWSTDLSSADVVHHFSVQGGSSNFCGYVKNQNIPLVISPILWLSDYIDQYPMEEIGHLLAIGDVICPNSNQETERFLSHFDVPRDKFIVTRNGVDRRFYQPSQAAMFRKHFDIEGGFILCVGNIEERKNQHRLAMAAAAIDMPLVLIGHVRDQGYFDHLMQSAGNNTQYLGAL